LSDAPPDSAALLAHARSLCGLTIGTVAAALDVAPPDRPSAAKGFVGELLERALGASAGNDAAPDFPDLGIELKTIPLRRDGRPSESTWVTRVVLDGPEVSCPFEQSSVGRKLDHVLWLPIEVSESRSPLERRIGQAVLWRPSHAERSALVADYDELMGRIAAGGVDDIDARLGAVLQIRPKGRDARDRARAVGHDGHTTWTSTRGFYLRPRFTAAVLARLHGAAGPFPSPDRGASLAP
jgi:DNA mismatch repair protein MutH